jgi:hypothetical protein
MRPQGNQVFISISQVSSKTPPVTGSFLHQQLG